MSVVQGRKIIFCEGKEASYDSKLLEKVIENVSGEKPTIIGSGGKFTFSKFAEGYFFPQELVNQRYLVFRDRDFDAVPTEASQLLQLTRKRLFLSHRACVENYLLNVELIHKYWHAKFQEKEENPSSKWGHGDSPGINAISTWIEHSARNLKDYQAVRWALGHLIQMKASRKQLSDTWTAGSGKLPSSLSLSDCRQEAITLIENFRTTLETVSINEFESSLDKYLQQFSMSEFWEQRQYFIWFHGKDIQKEMQKQKNSYISLENFFDWAVKQFDVTQHPDLMELRKKIEEL